jgi:glutamine kinase
MKLPMEAASRLDARIAPTGVGARNECQYGAAARQAAVSPDTMPGRVFWITGLSGAGKTTIGGALWVRLRNAGRAAIFLDGDTLRGVIADDLQHDPASRKQSAMRNARFCQMLSGQGLDVVCATISLFHEVQRWNRANIPLYQEIYLRVPMDELQRRDVKGIYGKARRGQIQNVVGLDVPAEVPEMPDLVLDNHGELDAEAAANTIWNRLAKPPGTAVASNHAAIRFGTKAETLLALASVLRTGHVLPQVRFSVSAWRQDPPAVLREIRSTPWGAGSVIVRSSARTEDGSSNSQAGHYVSVPEVKGTSAICRAIEKVIASFDDGGAAEDQVFLQPMLSGVAMAGVAFSRNPNGHGPYFVINYDDVSGRTDMVTAGAGNHLKTFYCLKSRPDMCPDFLAPVLAVMTELDRLMACDGLDIEFAVDGESRVHLLQARPLTGDRPDIESENDDLVDTALVDISRKVELLCRPLPFLHGQRTLFGVMPDWNPAEIIGLRPGPLSLSLYRELITDSIWAYQRDNYGYQNLRSFPLLVSFHGLPYIDVRVSFNSFVPNDIPDEFAGRLVNYYIDRLAAEPYLHDKVEFDIIFSCYTLDLPQRVATLREHGFTCTDLYVLSDSLRRLTNRIIHGQNGIWRQDLEKIDLLARRLPSFHEASIDKIARIYWLIEDCKRYGTLPFAGLARAGFIAVQILRSFVTCGILSEDEHAGFMASIDTIGSRIGRDFTRLSKEDFLERYGHLRPGTYDIMSPRYDEQPDLYFDWSAKRAPTVDTPVFRFSPEQLRKIESLIAEHALETDPARLIEFIRAGVEGREYGKFIFTRNLSDALSLIRKLARDHGIAEADCGFVNYDDIRRLYSRSGGVKDLLEESVRHGKRRHMVTKSLVLPPVIASPDDVFAFHLPLCEPNFITRNSVTAPTSSLSDAPESLAGTILFVPSADPGFDWIFSRGIAGFVTQFGGVNSHMAIRAGELGIPAVIGAGEALYQRWGSARTLHVDCSNQTVQFVT